MRLFTASLATESNSFSPIPTNRASYEAAFYYPPGQHPDVPRHTTAPLYVARRRARQEGFELVEGSCFWAEPSGPTKQADYEEMRDEILDRAFRRDAGRRRAARAARGDDRLWL